jgi:hypothetical protein
MRVSGVMVAGVIVAALGGCAGAQDATSNPLADNAERARRAVVRFMDAVNAGDDVTLGNLIFVRTDGGAQSQGRTAVIKCIVEQRALERAVAARWGADAAKEFGGAFMSFTPADRAAVEKARIDVHEREEVHVITGPNVAPIVLRRVRSDGQWQVALRVVSSMVDGGGSGRSEESTQSRLKYLERVQQALSYVGRRVGEKRIDTAAAARRELDDAMKRVAEQKDVLTE